MDSTNAFVQARDFLMANRTDYAAAYRGFEWPRLEQFNWALDYFDVYAKGNNRPALWLVEESGNETKLSFAEMSERSNRVANFFRGLGSGAAIRGKLPLVQSNFPESTISPPIEVPWPPMNLVAE